MMFIIIALLALLSTSAHAEPQWIEDANETFTIPGFISLVPRLEYKCVESDEGTECRTEHEGWVLTYRSEGCALNGAVSTFDLPLNLWMPEDASSFEPGSTVALECFVDKAVAEEEHQDRCAITAASSSQRHEH